MHSFPDKPQGLNWQDYPAGYISGAHGVSGNIILSLFSFPLLDIAGLKTLRLITYDKQVVEYKIKSIRAYKNSFVVNCGLKDRNMAEELKGSQLWLKKDYLLNSLSGFVLKFLGWELFDTNQNKICGTIIDFGFNGMQNLLVIKTEEGLFFDVPFFEGLEYIIQENQKRLELAVVEGLEGFTYSKE